MFLSHTMHFKDSFGHFSEPSCFLHPWVTEMAFHGVAGSQERAGARGEQISFSVLMQRPHQPQSIPRGGPSYEILLDSAQVPKQ